MIDRCKPEHKSRSSYYDKGIKVCEKWYVFENFLQDMGERPDGCTLDRIDNDLGYYIENCRWSTFGKQAQNRSSTVLSLELVSSIFHLRNLGLSLTEIGRNLNVNTSTVKNVIYRGDWLN